MRIAYFGGFFIAFIFFIGCTGVSGPTYDTYNYRAYDQSDRLVVVGDLVFHQLDTVHVKGAWQMLNVNGAEMTGISEAFGRFEGQLKADSLYIDLNPQWRDNNVILYGQFKNGIYQGKWQHIGFPGVMNEGRFEATVD